MAPETTEAGVFHGLSGQAKAVWDHLATTYADDRGIAYPGAARLAWGLSERGLQRCMAELVKKERINKISEAWRGQPIKYLVLPWSNSESKGRTSVHTRTEEGRAVVHPAPEMGARPCVHQPPKGPCVEHPTNGDGRTVVHPSGSNAAHNGVAEGHTLMPEKGAPLCAISPRDPLMNHHKPPTFDPPMMDGFLGKEPTGTSRRNGQVPRQAPTVAEIVARYTENHDVGWPKLDDYAAEVLFATRKGLKDPIALGRALCR